MRSWFPSIHSDANLPSPSSDADGSQDSLSLRAADGVAAQGLDVGHEPPQPPSPPLSAVLSPPDPHSSRSMRERHSGGSSSAHKGLFFWRISLLGHPDHPAQTGSSLVQSAHPHGLGRTLADLPRANRTPSAPAPPLRGPSLSVAPSTGGASSARPAPAALPGMALADILRAASVPARGSPLPHSSPGIGSALEAYATPASDAPSPASVHTRATSLSRPPCDSARQAGARRVPSGHRGQRVPSGLRRRSTG